MPGIMSDYSDRWYRHSHASGAWGGIRTLAVPWNTLFPEICLVVFRFLYILVALCINDFLAVTIKISFFCSGVVLENISHKV